MGLNGVCAPPACEGLEVLAAACQTEPMCNLYTGFPLPPFMKSKAPVTNIRNTASNYWKPWLKNPEQRCVAPATAFSEPDRNTSKPVQFRWCKRAEGGGETEAEGRQPSRLRRRGEGIGRPGWCGSEDVGSQDQTLSMPTAEVPQ